MDLKVHEVCDAIFVSTKSNAREGILARYAIRFGIVNWGAYSDPSNNTPHPAAWINYEWSQDGEAWTTEWKMPPHIMLEDLTGVIDALTRIKTKNRIK